VTQPTDEGNPPADSLEEAADRIADRLDTIDAGIAHLIIAKRRSLGWRIALGIVSALALASVIAVGFVVAQLQATNADLKATNRCLTVVVAANSDRIGKLTPAAAARTEADRAVDRARDGLLKLAIEQAPRAQLVAASKAFVEAKVADDKANAAYDEAVAANPPPPNPRDAC
jgi:hypothetical protein